MLKGIKSTQAKGMKRSVRLPITPELLLSMRSTWLGEGLVSQDDGRMLWAATALCFFAFLRSGEISAPNDTDYDEGAHLSFDYVTVDSFSNPSTLKVRIKASKTEWAWTFTLGSLATHFALLRRYCRTWLPGAGGQARFSGFRMGSLSRGCVLWPA